MIKPRGHTRARPSRYVPVCWMGFAKPPAIVGQGYGDLMGFGLEARTDLQGLSADEATVYEGHEDEDVKRGKESWRDKGGI